MGVEQVSVSSTNEFHSTISRYAQKGFNTVHNSGHRATMSKKKPFNWVLAIICLFIPIIGWIALIIMIFAAMRGNKVVEISLSSQGV